MDRRKRFGTSDRKYNIGAICFGMAGVIVFRTALPIGGLLVRTTGLQASGLTMQITERSLFLDCTTTSTQLSYSI